MNGVVCIPLGGQRGTDKCSVSWINCMLPRLLRCMYSLIDHIPCVEDSGSFDFSVQVLMFSLFYNQAHLHVGCSVTLAVEV